MKTFAFMVLSTTTLVVNNVQSQEQQQIEYSHFQSKYDSKTGIMEIMTEKTSPTHPEIVETKHWQGHVTVDSNFRNIQPNAVNDQNYNQYEYQNTNDNNINIQSLQAPIINAIQNVNNNVDHHDQMIPPRSTAPSPTQYVQQTTFKPTETLQVPPPQQVRNFDDEIKHNHNPILMQQHKKQHEKQQKKEIKVMKNNKHHNNQNNKKHMKQRKQQQQQQQKQTQKHAQKQRKQQKQGNTQSVFNHKVQEFRSFVFSYDYNNEYNLVSFAIAISMLTLISYLCIFCCLLQCSNCCCSSNDSNNYNSNNQNNNELRECKCNNYDPRPNDHTIVVEEKPSN